MRKLEAVLNVFVSLNIFGFGPDYPAMGLLGKHHHLHPFLEFLLQKLEMVIGFDILIIVPRSIEESRAFDLPGWFLVLSAVEALTLERRVGRCDGDHVIVDGGEAEGNPCPQQ